MTSSSESCPSDEEKEDILTQLNNDLDGIIDDQLAVFQALSFPVACPGEGWIKVADFNLEENSEAECPGGWVKDVSDNISHCRLPIIELVEPPTPYEPCLSYNHSTNSVSYTQVCGRVKSYQIGRTTAFFPSSLHPTLNDEYLDGVSITRGTPREHVWSFASGYFSSSSPMNTGYLCPCINGSSLAVPSIVGDNYFCDSGTAGEVNFRVFYGDNPLWDGAGCEDGNECCARGPYFLADLEKASCDDLETRICLSVSGKDRGRVNIGVSIIELYVK